MWKTLNSRRTASRAMGKVPAALCLLFLITSCSKDEGNNPAGGGQGGGINSVECTTDPAGFQIDLDGGTTGYTTPHTFEDLPVGSHQFRFHKVDYHDFDSTLYVAAGDHKVVHADVLPLWNWSWTGSVNLDFYNNGFWLLAMSTPTTLHASISITYSNYDPIWDATLECGSSSYVLGHGGGGGQFTLNDVQLLGAFVSPVIEVHPPIWFTEVVITINSCSYTAVP